MAKNTKALIFIIIFLFVTLCFSVFLVLRTTVFFGKAAGSTTSSLVLENSYLFASPIQAKADGKEQIRISAYLLDGRGIGIANLKVNLRLPSSVSVNATQPVSDDSGKTVFDIFSSVKGNYEIAATVEGKSVPQKVKVIFY